MSRRAQTRTTLTRTSQSRRAASLLLALTAPELEPCNSPSIPPSPKDRFFAWQGVEDDGKRTAWFTHSLLFAAGSVAGEYRVVPLLSGCTGILNAMESFMQVFP